MVGDRQGTGAASNKRQKNRIYIYIFTDRHAVVVTCKVGVHACARERKRERDRDKEVLSSGEAQSNVTTRHTSHVSRYTLHVTRYIVGRGGAPTDPKKSDKGSSSKSEKGLLRDVETADGEGGIGPSPAHRAATDAAAAGDATAAGDRLRDKAGEGVAWAASK